MKFEPQEKVTEQRGLKMEIGPVLVSSSVIKDPQNLTIKGTYNGAVVQDGHTK